MIGNSVLAFVVLAAASGGTGCNRAPTTTAAPTATWSLKVADARDGTAEVGAWWLVVSNATRQGHRVCLVQVSAVRGNDSTVFPQGNTPCDEDQAFRFVPAAQHVVIVLPPSHDLELGESPSKIVALVATKTLGPESPAEMTAVEWVGTAQDALAFGRQLVTTPAK